MYGNDEVNNAWRDAQHTLTRLMTGFVPERMTTPVLSQIATDLENLARSIRQLLNDRLDQRSGL